MCLSSKSDNVVANAALWMVFNGGRRRFGGLVVGERTVPAREIRC
jgi:hypothetical protein